MRYSTIKNIYNICKSPELQKDINAKNTKNCVRIMIKSSKFLKQYIKDLNYDINNCLQDIKENNFFADNKLLQNLILEKNDILNYINKRN